MNLIVAPFGWLMRVLYQLVDNYGLALLFFTVITRVIMLPISISQQKSMAKMSVYNPLIQEIQKKYANNREKQQEEMTRLYTDYNIKPSMGCMPMLLQFAFVMILYQVIQQPLRYMVGLNTEVYNQVLELARTLPGCPNTYQDAFVIRQIQDGSTAFLSLIGQQAQQMVEALDFSFLGIQAMDLTQIPTFGFNVTIIIPVISCASMILTQWITGKITGQQLKGATNLVMYGMSLWIGYLGFTFPAALSLYWFYSNVLGVGQSLVLRKWYSPEKFKEQIQAELAAKRAEKKRKKTVTVTDEATGEQVQKEVTEAELAKLRLARARALQEEKFRQQAAEDAAKKQGLPPPPKPDEGSDLDAAIDAAIEGTAGADTDADAAAQSGKKKRKKKEKDTE